MESSVPAAAGFTEGVTGIISDMGSVTEFFWSLFSDFLGLFVKYPLISFPVLFGILVGFVGLVIFFSRRFGLRGRRR